MTYFEKLYLISQYLIFITSVIYAGIALKQLLAIHRQADIANKTLLLMQRPKLRIRNVAVKPIPLADNATQLLQQPLHISFSIVNVGNAVAQNLKRDCIAFFTSSPLPMPLLYAERPSLPIAGNISLRPGETHQVTLYSSQPLDDVQPGTMNVHFEKLYIMGYVEYEDELNLTRRTAFCRRLTADTRYFIAEENPDYEHED